MIKYSVETNKTVNSFVKGSAFIRRNFLGEEVFKNVGVEHMNSQEYLQAVKSRFNHKVTVRLDKQDMFIAYEEVFKWAWMATKLKITSFVKIVPSAQLSDFESYSENCLKQAIRDKKGLPVGFQNAVVSYSVMASEAISSEAIVFATSRPKKHFAAFETPVLFDLNNNELYYYKEKIIWGRAYDRFFKEYLLNHFK